MASKNAIIETEGLTKSFDGLVAVNDVTWTLRDDRTMGILGPNGAGKSTLFNLIAGVLQPTAGRVYLNGEDITDLPANKRTRRGLVKTFQTNNLFEGETVLDNIKIAAQVNEGVFNVFKPAETVSAVNQRAEEILETLQLTEVEDELVDELSHGNQRKVEIGIAMATNPDVVLLDEPTSGVSNEEMNVLQKMFRELLTEQSMNFVFIEHNVDFLMNIVDEVTVLHDGEIMAQDTPAEIMDNEDVQRIYLD